MQLIYAKNYNSSSEIADIWYVLDFLYLSKNNDDIRANVPLGIQRIDISGPTRKTVQQTRAGSYVDTWDIGPNTISISGSVAVPEGYEVSVLKYQTAARMPFDESLSSLSFVDTSDYVISGGKHDNSVLGVIDRMYYRNANTEDVSTDRLFWKHYRDSVITPVTIVSRMFTVSIESSFIMNFQIQLLTLMPDTLLNSSGNGGRKGYVDSKYKEFQGLPSGVGATPINVGYVGQ